MWRRSPHKGEVTTPTAVPVGRGGRHRTRNRPEPCSCSGAWTPAPYPLPASSPSPAAPTHLVHLIIPELWRPQQGQSAREGGGTGQQGTAGRGGQLNPRARALPQLLKTPTSPHPYPSQVLPSTPPGAEAGLRPGERSTVHHSPVQHAACREWGQPAGKSCLGFSYCVSPQALTGVPRETECPPPHLDTGVRLLGWEIGLYDPVSVTALFCPLAEEGSLVP